jgi:DNA-binding transcriptional MerR regulator
VRAPSRQRLYRRADVEMLLYIRGLLHEEGYTIAGAKRRLDEIKTPPPAAAVPPAPAPAPAPDPPPEPLKGQQSLALVPPQPEPTPPTASLPSPVVQEVLDELRELLKKLS